MISIKDIFFSLRSYNFRRTYNISYLSDRVCYYIKYHSTMNHRDRFYFMCIFSYLSPLTKQGRFTKRMMVIPGLLIMLFSFPLFASTQPKGNFTITTRILSRTCEFKDSSNVIVLDDITTGAFTDNSIKAIKSLPINISCGTGVNAVNVVISGTPDTLDDSLFRNNAQNPSGNATGIGLQVSDKGRIIQPNASGGVLINLTNQVGSRTLQAGYVATQPGHVTSGAFATSLTLQFNYL